MSNTASPYAEEMLRHNGWTVFVAEDDYDDGINRYFAVNDTTGEVKDFDVTGWRHVCHAPQLFRYMIDLGFPRRAAVGSLSPLTAADVATLKFRSAAA